MQIINTDGDYWDEQIMEPISKRELEIDYDDGKEPIVFMAIIMVTIAITIIFLAFALISWPIIATVLLSLGKLTFLGSIKMALIVGVISLVISVIALITYLIKEC